jgi:hypothetical protein
MTAARRLAAIPAADVGVIGVAGPKTALTAASLQSSHCGLTQGGLRDAPGGARWPDPERTFVASDRMARFDVNRPFLIATRAGSLDERRQPEVTEFAEL